MSDQLNRVRMARPVTAESFWTLPLLLSRQEVSELTGVTRRQLDVLVEVQEVRVVTVGKGPRPRRRYLREDLARVFGIQKPKNGVDALKPVHSACPGAGPSPEGARA